jgi:lysozyme family protein
MAQFLKYFPTLLRFEGGFVDDPADPGGATNKGITLSTFSRYAKPLLGIQPTLSNLRALSDVQAAKIYKLEFWDRLLADEIAFQPLAEIVCDFYVNSGSHAVSTLYKVLNYAGDNHAVQDVLTREVVAGLHAHDHAALYAHYKHARSAYYISLAHEHPVLRRFLKGWLARVNAFPDLSVSLHQRC